MSTFFGPVTTSCRRYLPQIHSRYYAIGLAPIYFLFFIFPPFFSMPFAFLTIFRSRVCAFLFSFFVVSNRIPGWRFLKVFKRRCFPPHIRAGVPTRLAGRAACGAPFAHRLTKLFSRLPAGALQTSLSSSGRQRDCYKGTFSKVKRSIMGLRFLNAACLSLGFAMGRPRRPFSVYSVSRPCLRSCIARSL